jgi:hypothetical protein
MGVSPGGPRATFGSSAVSVRPVTLRAHLAMGLPFSGGRDEYVGSPREAAPPVRPLVTPASSPVTASSSDRDLRVTVWVWATIVPTSFD